MQPGAREFMQQLVNKTQPSSAKARADAEALVRESRKEAARKQLAAGQVYVKGEPADGGCSGSGRGSSKRGRGRARGGGRGRGRGRGTIEGSSGQAAVAAKQLAAAAAGATAGASSSGWGSEGSDEDADHPLGAAAGAGGGYALAAAAAAAAAAWPAAGALFTTWKDAPCGNFYTVDLVDVRGKVVAVLEPADIIDKERWQEELE